MFASQRRFRTNQFGVWLLLYQMLVTNESLPPVTLATVILNVVIFLGYVPFLRFHNVGQTCLNPSAVWIHQQWFRLVSSAVVHASDMHLYYNMISFIWKGRRLERKFGSPYFAYIISVFALVTGALITGVSVFLEQQLGFRHFQLMNQCAVGFSGVIFALKVLCNEYFPTGDAWLMGMIPVPSKYACWAELLLIQFLVPNASFTGHLAGIIVGLLYINGPLRLLMDILWQSPVTSRQSRSHRTGARSWGSGMSGTGDSTQWGNEHYNRYTAGLSEEEQMAHAMRESRNMYDTGPRFRPSAPPMEF